MDHEAEPLQALVNVQRPLETVAIARGKLNWVEICQKKCLWITLRLQGLAQNFRFYKEGNRSL